MIRLSNDDRKDMQVNYPQPKSGTHSIQGMGVHVARLMALRGGVKLEARGMRRSGRSCTHIVRQMFKMPASATREQLIARLTQEIEELTNGEATV